MVGMWDGKKRMVKRRITLERERKMETRTGLKRTKRSLVLFIYIC